MKKNIIVTLLVLIGITLILYPFISNYINGINQTKVIVDYQNEVEKISDEQKEEKIRNAEKYNEELEKDIHVDVSLENDNQNTPPSYLNLLDIGETMGYINIPKIEINLPIYHGTSNDVLKSGVGHLESSSLPVGGKGTHAVLAGHTGLATGKIFDNIDKLEIGDIFYINVLNKNLEYKVDNIVIVEPDDTNTIKVDPEKDYVTLVTCTPKVINSHRLLVRGERVDESTKKYFAEEQNNEKKENTTKQEVIKENKKQENVILKYIKENNRIVIILGIIIILIGIFILSHKYIKFD